MRHLIYMLLGAALFSAALSVIPTAAMAQWRPPTRAEIKAAGEEAAARSEATETEAGNGGQRGARDSGQRPEPGRNEPQPGTTDPDAIEFREGLALGEGSPSGEGNPFGEGFSVSRPSRQGGYLYSQAGYVPTVALMLPLEGVTAAGNDFTEFYKGALLALEDLKAQGHSLNVALYNTARSAEKVFETVISPEFANTDLIIGPVYESEMSAALQYAEAFKIPIVSPLAAVRELDGAMLYRMAPDPSTKYDKLRDIWGAGGPDGDGGGSGSGGINGGGKNIILVSSEAGSDAEFEREITTELERAGQNYGRFTIPEKVATRPSAPGKTSEAAELGELVASLIDWERENVFVVLAATELVVDKALTTIASAYKNASARNSSRKADIAVVGSSRWASYNLDKELLFKLNVRFVTSYYINRSGTAEARFEQRYLEAYGDYPPTRTARAAYRGYDAVALFAGALFEPGFSFDDRLAKVAAAPLGTPYRFVHLDDGRTSRINDQWTLVRFTDGFDVIVQ